MNKLKSFFFTVFIFVFISVLGFGLIYVTSLYKYGVFFWMLPIFLTMWAIVHRELNG